MTHFPIRRTIGAALAAAAFVTVAFVAATIGAPAVDAQTGGQTVPCPGSPWGNGWFYNGNNGTLGSVNCTRMNNHIVVDAYNSQGTLTRAVIDMWYGSACDTVTFVNGSSTEPFRVKLRNDSYGYSGSSGCGTHGPAIYQNGSGTWTQSWTTTNVDTVNQCHVLQSTRACGTLDGWTVARARGINNGPYTPVSFVGFAGCWCANQFVTDVYALVTS